MYVYVCVMALEEIGKSWGGATVDDKRTWQQWT